MSELNVYFTAYHCETWPSEPIQQHQKSIQTPSSTSPTLPSSTLLSQQKTKIESIFSIVIIIILLISLKKRTVFGTWGKEYEP